MLLAVPAKDSENSTHFQTGLPSETRGNYEYRQL